MLSLIGVMDEARPITNTIYELTRDGFVTAEVTSEASGYRQYNDLIETQFAQRAEEEKPVIQGVIGDERFVASVLLFKTEEDAPILSG